MTLVNIANGPNPTDFIQGRLISGHPMLQYDVIDPTTKQPKVKDGVKIVECGFGFAIPKNGSTDWRQTWWGQQIEAIAKADFPNGEWQRPDFSWKIIDGDSTIPNKKGNKPCDMEGAPGNWVVWPKTQAGLTACFPVGSSYGPYDQMQDSKAIKTGDYGYLVIDAKGNAPSQTPGTYINPKVFVLTNAGTPIVKSNVDAAAIFGGVSAPTAPAGTATPTQSSTPPAQTTQPAPAPINPATGELAPAGTATPTQSSTPPAAPVEKYLVQGQEWTRDQLKAAGWTDAQIDAQQRV